MENRCYMENMGKIMESLDAMHSENIMFTWSKSFNYSKSGDCYRNSKRAELILKTCISDWDLILHS